MDQKGVRCHAVALQHRSSSVARLHRGYNSLPTRRQVTRLLWFDIAAQGGQTQSTTMMTLLPCPTAKREVAHPHSTCRMDDGIIGFAWCQNFTTDEVFGELQYTSRRNIRHPTTKHFLADLYDV